MNILILAEHNQGQLSGATGRAVKAAAGLNGAIHLLVAGEQAPAVAKQATQLAGVERVLVEASAAVAQQLAEPTADLIVSLAADYEVLMAPATAHGKNVMPRVAALLDVMQVSDIIEIVSEDTFKRPIYAGNAIQTVRSREAKRVLTIRTAAFDLAEAGGNAEVVSLSLAADQTLSTYVGEELADSERPELGAARVIVSGGRALGSKERFDEVILPFADSLSASVGASRAAVDSGYAPNDWQVGQTGKIVAPDLYIACGISGAIQHLAGMKDSKVIVAINKDEEAPIFQIADYGLVGDLFEVLPALQSELAK